MKIRKKQNGISLISLVIVIIIILILTASIIITVLADSPIGQANEAVIKSDIKTMQEEYELAYSEAYIKNLGDASGIKNSDFLDVVPDKYKNDFKATSEGLIYVGDDETIEKIALEMGIPKKEFNVIEEVLLSSKFTSIDIQTTILQGEVIDGYVYQIREKGTEEWSEFSSSESKITIENLNQDVVYEIKVIAKQGEKEYESTIQEIKTKKEIALGTLIMKINDANGDAYSENTWINEKIYIQVEGENTTYSATGANTVSETTSSKILESEGITTITLKTKSEEDERTQTYTVKIDKSVPVINSFTSLNENPTNQNVTLTAKAKDETSGIVAYQFSKDDNLTASSTGWEQIESTTNEIERSYTISENETYYFYVKDGAGNVVKESYTVDYIDTTAPTLNSINVTAPATGTYTTGQVVTFVATYSENITGTAPILKIKFGTGPERAIANGTINGNTITYEYTIVNSDLGELASTEYTGTITDIAGNSLTVSNKTLEGSKITVEQPDPILAVGRTFKSTIPSETTSIVFTDEIAPTGATLTDVSAEGNNSVVAWLDGTTYKVSTQIENREVLANPDCSWMFNGESFDIDFSNFNTSNVTSMQGMFQNFGQALDLSNFDTSNVTDMNQMFSRIRIETLDLSNFNTGNVTTMYMMFGDYTENSTLKTLIQNFDTSNVKTMYYMFANCTSLTSIEVADWNVGNVEIMRALFSGCTKLSSIAIDNWDVSKVESMYEMFKNCISLTSLNFKNWKTPNLGNGGSYRSSNGVIIETYNMGYMFYGCTGLTELDLSSFDTSYVEDMNYLFSGCSNLTKLNVSSFDTSKVKDMDNMFARCSSLVSIDVSNFNTSSAKNMMGMFGGCTSLTELDLSSFSTSSIPTYANYLTGLSYMFNNCTSLKSLDISNFDTTNNPSMSAMFNNCYKLEEITIGEKFTAQEEFPEPSPDYIEGADGFWYSKTTSKGYYKDQIPLNVADTYLAVKPAPEGIMLISGGEFNSLISYEVAEVVFTNTEPSEEVVNNGINIMDLSKEQNGGIIGWLDDYTLYVSIPSTAGDLMILGNEDSSYMFANTEIRKVDFSNFSTYYVETMENMFENCNYLEEVTFAGEFKLIDNLLPYPDGSYIDGADGGWFDKSGRYEYSYWPDYLSELGYYDGTLVASYLLIGNDNYGGSLGSVTLTDGNTFNANISQEALSIKFTDEVAPDWYSLYDGTLLDVSENSDGSVVAWFDSDTMTYMVSSQQSGVMIEGNQNCSNMFSGLPSLEEIDLSGLNTTNVTDMSFMFGGCISLKNIDISSWNTSNVINMEGMFNYCPSLMSVDVSKIDTSSVEDMSNMFADCDSLTNAYMSNFDTTNAYDLSNMFYGCDNLKTIDISNFDTTNADTSCMFYDCNKLQEVKLGVNFVFKAEDSYLPTQNSDYISTADGYWYNTNGESFTPEEVPNNVADTYYGVVNKSVMKSFPDFQEYSSEITRVVFKDETSVPSEATSWDISNASDGSVMAYIEDDGSGGYVLTIGGNGKIYANEDSSGLFDSFYNLTEIENMNLFDTSNVIYMNNMFGYCTNLISLDLSNFNTSNVNSMYDMFEECESLTSLNISNFDTSNVFEMDGMFRYCRNLTSLDINDFDTSNVIYMNNMFEECNNLTTTISIYTNNVSSYDYMFTNAATMLPAKITVNYTLETSDLVDYMIDTKSTDSNVVKGIEVTSPEVASAFSLLANREVEYTEPETADIVTTVNKDSDGTVTGIYINASDENGIETLTILNSTGNIVEQTQVNGQTSYSAVANIVDAGIYEVELVNSIGETKKVTFEI